MSLGHRLDTLRRQSGECAAESAADPVSTGLIERLQRARPTHRHDAPVPDASCPERLAGQTGGCFVAPGVLVVEERIALAIPHGRWRLPMENLPFVHLPPPGGARIGDVVFLDTETTGLSGGSGTTVFLLGLARIESGYLVLRQYLLTAFAGEAAMLRDAAKWMGPTPVFVSYNGKTFDVPLLSTRSRLSAVPDAYTARPHLDLLHATRRAFGACWPDCRLATLEQRLLGVTREDDLPGAEAPAAWLDFLRHGRTRRLLGVLRHNRWDLLSLAAAWPALESVHDRPSDHGADVLAVARSRIRGGDYASALDLLWTARAQLSVTGALELARLLRRTGRWDDARRIWETLATQGEDAAWEALAKYHEHVSRDASAALACVRALPATADHLHRRRRLESKLATLSLF